MLYYLLLDRFSTFDSHHPTIIISLPPIFYYISFRISCSCYRRCRSLCAAFVCSVRKPNWRQLFCSGKWDRDRGQKSIERGQHQLTKPLRGFGNKIDNNIFVLVLVLVLLLWLLACFLSALLGTCGYYFLQGSLLVSGLMRIFLRLSVCLSLWVLLLLLLFAY